MQLCNQVISLAGALLGFTNNFPVATDKKRRSAGELTSQFSLATSCHSMQVYYQIQESGEAVETSDNLNARDCGLEMVNNKLLPTRTDLSLAPAALLLLFGCNCKTGCESKKCTCQSNDLIEQMHVVTVKDRTVVLLPNLRKN